MDHLRAGIHLLAAMQVIQIQQALITQQQAQLRFEIPQQVPITQPMVRVHLYSTPVLLITPRLDHTVFL